MTFGDHVSQDRHCLLQALHVEAYIGDYRPLFQITDWLTQNRLDARLHVLDEPGNMTGQVVMRLESFHRSVDGAPVRAFL